MTNPSIEDFFNQATASGPAVATFDFKGQSADGVGLAVGGEIVRVELRDLTDYEDNTKVVRDKKTGEPVKQLVVDLQTSLRNWEGAKKPLEDDNGSPLPASEDDGLRRIFMRYQGVRAIGEAVRAAGAEFKDLYAANTGAQLWVKRIASDPKTPRMMQFEAKFKKGDRQPAVEDVFASQSAPAAEAPAAPAQSDSPWSTPVSSDEPPF